MKASLCGRAVRGHSLDIKPTCLSLRRGMMIDEAETEPTGSLGARGLRGVCRSGQTKQKDCGGEQVSRSWHQNAPPGLVSDSRRVSIVTTPPRGTDFVTQ